MFLKHLKLGVKHYGTSVQCSMASFLAVFDGYILIDWWQIRSGIFSMCLGCLCVP